MPDRQEIALAGQARWINGTPRGGLSDVDLEVPILYVLGGEKHSKARPARRNADSRCRPCAQITVVPSGTPRRGPFPQQWMPRVRSAAMSVWAV